LKRINVSLSPETHQRLVKLRKVLMLDNFDEVIAEVVARVYKEVVEKYE